LNSTGSASSSPDSPPTANTSEAQTKRQKTPEEALKKAALERQDDLQRDWDAKKLTYEEFLPRTQNPSPDTYIIDVREREEVMQGMIPGAVNVPLSVLSSALHLSPGDFQQKFGFEKPTVEHELVFYCRSGMRSASATDVAKRNGYNPEKIYNYRGSWLEWTAKHK
jgi:rhodanese-related sulfurtransferase